ncbi:hypothetical protein H8959_021331 [Pygathrix nigripes]
MKASSGSPESSGCECTLFWTQKILGLLRPRQRENQSTGDSAAGFFLRKPLSVAAGQKNEEKIQGSFWEPLRGELPPQTNHAEKASIDSETENKSRKSDLSPDSAILGRLIPPMGKGAKGARGRQKMKASSGSGDSGDRPAPATLFQFRRLGLLSACEGTLPFSYNLRVASQSAKTEFNFLNVTPELVPSQDLLCDNASWEQNTNHADAGVPFASDTILKMIALNNCLNIERPLSTAQ